MNLRVFYLYKTVGFGWLLFIYTRRWVSDGYLKKPRDQQVARLFILKDFIAFPSVWRGGKNVEINTLGS